MRRFLVWSSVLLFIGILIATLCFRSVKGRIRLIRLADSSALGKTHVVRWTNIWRFNFQEGGNAPGHKYQLITVPFVMFQVQWFFGGFHCEYFEGNSQEVKALIDQGADVNALDKRGRTPIEYAARENHPDVVVALLQNGADGTVLNMLTLKHLIGMNQVEVMSALVHEGVPMDVNQKYEAESLIDMATRLERKEILELLEPLAKEESPVPLPTGS